MSIVSHTSAKPSHYNKEAQNYDAFNEEHAATINKCIEEIFKKHQIKTVLDLTCGTGLQVFWLVKQGFEVIGSDINAEMLKIAKKKAEQKKVNIKFIKGNMCTTQAGKFDAVITIFNSIGHLTKQDFEKAIQNIHTNLVFHGLYVFDIFNLHYLLEGDNITKLTIDWLKKCGDAISREIQYSTISHNGILASYDIYHEQKGIEKLKISSSFQTLQVYSREQLKKMLENNGFKVLKQCDIDGSKFYDNKTERILTLAKKQ